jgi:hypothetical protein
MRGVFRLGLAARVADHAAATHTPSFRQAASAAPIRNPSKASALYDEFQVSAALRPE